VYFEKNSSKEMSRDSSVDIATGYGLEDRMIRVRFSVGAENFSLRRCVERLWGPLILVSNGYRELFPWE
jgi:hypothetical protein